MTTPDGRASAFYYNHHSQLTSATGPDGLEMRRKYDESGRLIQETAPDGDITLNKIKPLTRNTPPSAAVASVH
ncbi:RHS repeat domain-containing protein [Escherichia coli]